VNCSFDACPAKVHARGFCPTHWGQWRRGWLTLDGRPTDLWRPYIPVDPERRCRVQGCAVNRPLYRGMFCGQHANWFKAGVIDRDGRPLKELPRAMVRRCQVEGCEVGPSQRCGGLCRQHHDQEAAQGYSVPRRGCLVCGTHKTRLIKELCSRHYGQYRHGIIDRDGQELRELIQRPPYPPDAQCRARGCKVKPVGRGFCDRHYNQWQHKKIDDSGRPLVAMLHYNVGQVCRVPRCRAPAHCKSMCTRHYNQTLRGTFGTVKQKDLPCKVEGCGEQANTKGLCRRHYARMRYMVDRENILAGIRQQREKDAACTSQESIKKLSPGDPTLRSMKRSTASPGMPTSNPENPSM